MNLTKPFFWDGGPSPSGLKPYIYQYQNKSHCNARWNERWMKNGGWNLGMKTWPNGWQNVMTHHYCFFNRKDVPAYILDTVYMYGHVDGAYVHTLFCSHVTGVNLLCPLGTVMYFRWGQNILFGLCINMLYPQEEKVEKRIEIHKFGLFGIFGLTS